jgi:hypothetical protein
MCKLCDKFRPKEWNFCPICGNEINIPRYNIDDTLEELLERVAIGHETILKYLKVK